MLPGVPPIDLTEDMVDLCEEVRAEVPATVPKSTQERGVLESELEAEERRRMFEFGEDWSDTELAHQLVASDRAAKEVEGERLLARKSPSPVAAKRDSSTCGMAARGMCAKCLSFIT